MADPNAVLIAVCEDEPSPLDGADLPTIRIGGLSRGEAASLLDWLSPDVAARLYDAAAGNPLGLMELAGDADELALEPEGVPMLTSASGDLRQAQSAASEPASVADTLPMLV